MERLSTEETCTTLDVESVAEWRASMSIAFLAGKWPVDGCTCGRILRCLGLMEAAFAVDQRMLLSSFVKSPYVERCHKFKSLGKRSLPPATYLSVCGLVRRYSWRCQHPP
jgi:hypothetical protein